MDDVLDGPIALERAFDPQAEVLGELLRGERAAVETYEQALESIKDAAMRKALDDCRASHEERVMQLEAAILALGGDPGGGSGVWGMVAGLAEGSATLLGDTATIGMLAQGEAHGQRLYERESMNLEGDPRRLVEETLYPAQLRTREAIDALRGL